MTHSSPRICIIGFGEAGSALAQGFARTGISCWDIALNDPAMAPKMRQRMDLANIAAGNDIKDAVAHADVIFSVVTADQAQAAAGSVAAHIASGALFFDCNSCAPGTKQHSASLIDAAGGRYVDVAIMAPIDTARHQTPTLVASEHADEALAIMQELDMRPTLVGRSVGRASTIKMLRSVMVKGIEALTAECFRAACRAGVADEVASSLDASQTKMGWAGQASYNLERMTTHGIRRAEEMREVAKTLADLGIASHMTDGTIEWQQIYGHMFLDLTGMDGLQRRIAAIEEQSGYQSTIQINRNDEGSNS